MRVLIIVENLPVPLDRRVWQEACALRDAGHEVTVICPQMRGFNEPEEMLEGIQIFRHWISGEASGLGGFFAEYTTALLGEMISALKAWRRRGFDVIHLCNPPDLLFLIALPFKWLAGVKVIYDVHDLWPEMFEAKFQCRGLLYQAIRLAERCTLALADVVLATNESVRSVILERGKKHDSQVFTVRTAPNTLDLTAPVDQSLRKGRRHLVSYIGVIGSADGVEYLIEAVAHIVRTRQRHDVHFLLMGHGPEYDRVLALRDAQGLAAFIDMPGRVTDNFLCSALQTMDLGVACDPINTYNDHCTMNKTLEYMAFGKAQVIFGTQEGRFSAGEAALCVMENSAEKLGNAILELLDDEPRRLEMGQKGRDRLMGELSWEHSVQALLQAYQAVG
jgi:glycosyltransferase involved in cell wall biosynthesis